VGFTGDKAPRTLAPAIAPPAPTDLRAAGATAIDIRGRWLTAGAGSVWLSGRTALYRLDAATGRRIATVSVRQRPCEGTAVGLGAVWTATCGASGLARIDPTRNRVSGHVALRVPRELGGEAEIATGAGSVWLVVDGRGCGSCRVNDVVQRIDPRRDRVAGTLRTGDMPRFLTGDRTGVWILNQADGTATHVDPRTGAVPPPTSACTAAAAVSRRAHAGSGRVEANGCSRAWIRAPAR